VNADAIDRDRVRRPVVWVRRLRRAIDAMESFIRVGRWVGERGLGEGVVGSGYGGLPLARCGVVTVSV